MDIARIADLRPRFVWDIVDDAFDLYREHFALLCGVSAVVSVPVGLLALAFTNLWSHSLTGTGSSSDSVTAYFGWLGISFPLMIAGRVFQDGATALVVRDILEGQTPTLAETYRRVGKRFFALFFSGLGIALFAVMGLCAIYVGALYVVVYLSFVGQGILIEGRGMADAFRRSNNLATDDRGRIFGVMALIWLVTTVVALGLGAVLSGAVEFLPGASGTAGPEKEAQKALIQQGTSGIVQVLLAPMYSIALTLLYFDLRVRREGIDLAAQARDEGVTLAPDPFGDLPSARVVRQQRRGQSRATRRAGKTK